MPKLYKVQLVIEYAFSLVFIFELFYSVHVLCTLGLVVLLGLDFAQHFAK